MARSIDAAHEADQREFAKSSGPKVPRRIMASALLFAALGAFGFCWYIFATHTSVSTAELVHVELAGRSQTLPLTAATVSALYWDYLFIAGYGIALLAGGWAARQVFWTPQACRVAAAGVGLAFLTVLVDVLENLLLLGASASAGSPRAAWLADAAAGMAIVKFSALVPAGLVALSGAVTLLARAIGNNKHTLERAAKQLEPPEAAKEKLVAHSAAPIEGDDPDTIWMHRFPPVPAPPSNNGTAVETDLEETRWRNSFRVPDVDLDGIEDAYAIRRHTIGFCVSGGGIRAGSVALGALQSLRPQLQRAKYLVSVSGGGFTAGAMSLALSPRDPEAGRPWKPPSWLPKWVRNFRARPKPQPPDSGRQVTDPGTVFLPGTVEADHLARHSSYLADTPGEMISALGVVFGHLLASLLLLFAPAVVVGALLGRLYHAVPVADLSKIPAGGTQGNVPFPGVGWPAVFGFGLPAALAMLAWLVHLSIEMFGTKTTAWVTWERIATVLMWVALLVVVTTVAVPALLWASAWVLSGAGSAGISFGGSIGTVVLTYLSLIATMLWRNRKVVSSAVSGTGKKGTDGSTGVAAALPRGPVQYLLVVATLVLLAAGWLLLCGGVATRTTRTIDLVVAASIAGVLVVLGGLLDQTSLSLHPFYRRRLATAIAVRRVERGGAVLAEPYGWDERTRLARYAHRGDGQFPSVIFAAAANLAGEHRTAPGLGAVSFTMGADWVGGPDVGWIRTETLEKLVTPRLQRDLTVQAAVAISGAAFASAMGRHGAWYQTLLAVTGARLGSWLPNPAFVMRRTAMAGDEDWRIPGLPRVRRLTYLLREIVGIHRSGDRLLHVTDGGHYDNLGLVEVLRRRCTLVYCIDASGDAPPTAATLAEAITLARAELGVQIVPDDPWPLEPGTGKPLDKATILQALNDKISKSPILTATIHYPPESGLNGVTGRLIVAKALLDRTAPYEVLSHAATSPVFPHDSTGDQFFGHEQFQAYVALGRHLGKLAAVQPQWPVASRKWSDRGRRETEVVARPRPAARNSMSTWRQSATFWRVRSRD